MTRILFACVGNSCRSQMAEAFCRELGSDVECASAGTRPAGEVQPETVTVMAEAGIDITEARPKSFDDLPDLQFDILVTMGCDVTCPILPGAEVVRWEIPDPYDMGIESYRTARDTIRGKVLELLD